MKKLKEDIKYQLEEFELGGIDVWELIKRIETIVNLFKYFAKSNPYPFG